MTLAAEVVARMTARGLTLATAESTVGGLIGHLLTDVPGASKVFMGGVAAYHGSAKLALLHVPRETLAEHGSVSEATVLAMARGAREVLGADVAVAESGIASPTDNRQRPAGLYYLALVAEAYACAVRRQFAGERGETKRQAAEAALRLVLDYLDETG